MAVVLLTVFYVNAQSFTLEWGDEVLADTITLNPVTAEDTEIVFEAIFHNLTDNGANIKVIRKEISIIETSVNSFCWNLCFPPFVDTSGNFIYIPAGGYSEEAAFSAHFEIHDAVGVSVIEYTFYNMDNPDENVKIVVNFDTSPTAINENILKSIWVSDIYPNPATNFVKVDYKLPHQVEAARVKIVNLLGSVVKEQVVDTQNSSLQIDINDINSGIYFYSLIANGEVVSTSKLIVR